MKTIKAGSALIGAMILLAGCAAQTPVAEVTRFHLEQPVTQGTIVVDARDPAQSQGLEFDNYAASISRELKAHGFSIAPDRSRADLVALIEVERITRQTGPARSAFSIGLGGGTFGGGVGVGGGVSFPVGKKTVPEATRTTLFVQIKRRSTEGPVIWEGRGHIEARNGTPYASPAAAVDRLATALFKDFPGESGRTISVK